MLDRSGPDAPLTPSNSSLFASDPGESPGMLAGALSTPVAPGHFDEMHGVAMRPSAGPAPAAPQSDMAAAPLTEHWGHFFESLGTDGFSDLNRRTAALHRQIRDNGVTYNVYADASTAQRPWSLDLFPLIVSPQSWQQNSQHKHY